MGSARIFHTATLLADGTALVVNSGLSNDAPTSAELYDPQSGQWAATASPANPRYGYSATRLSDGSVLLTGDYDDESRGSSELYAPGTGS
jgi:hypothetical protein